MDSLQSAFELLQTVASDLKNATGMGPSEVRDRLRATSHRILDLLEEHDSRDVMSSLERQSREIAEELKRVERLMGLHQPEDD